LTSGFKSAESSIVYEGMDNIRQSCGGAGFSAWSGLPLLIQDYAPNTTFEGDNTMLLQQCAKLITKNLKNIATKGYQATGYFDYFNNIDVLLSKKVNITSSDQLLSVELINDALAIRAASLSKIAAEALASSKASENENINSIYSMELVNAARAHIMYVGFRMFRDGIQKANFKCPKITENLKNLLLVYGLNELAKSSAAVYETGFFTVGAGPMVLEAQKKLMTLLRPQMIPIIESYQYTDNNLVSAIGNSHGDIYET
jgi:acyl-CoA oxidase